MHDIHIPKDIQARYLTRKSPLGMAFLGLAVLGFGAFAFLLTSDPNRAWEAYASNWFFWTSIAQGAVMLAVVTVIVKAKWNWSVRRISLAFGAFLPIAFLLVIPMLLGLREDYFPWLGDMATDTTVAKKLAYLNLPFLISRTVVGLLVLFTMSLIFMYFALRPDMGPDRAGDEEGDGGRARWRERLSGGWAGQEKEEARSWARLKVLAPAMALVYAVVMSIVATDWAMSVAPGWYSMLFPAWFFMGGFWGGILLTALVAVLLKRAHPAFDEDMGPQQLHDLGKLSFAFSIFWAYLVFSQYIVIWYGQQPWEQSWVIARSGSEWGGLSLAMITLCFFVPFVGLLGRKPKMIPAWLGTIAVLGLAGLWLERFILIAPSLHESGTPTLTLWEPLIALGFFGLFAFTVRWFLTTFPVIQKWQHPQEPESIEAELPPEEARLVGSRGR